MGGFPPLQRAELRYLMGGFPPLQRAELRYLMAGLERETAAGLPRRPDH
jgi:hypothetical protein